MTYADNELLNPAGPSAPPPLSSLLLWSLSFSQSVEE